VTTAALALAFTWPSSVIVAECDPAGGAVLAGALAGHLPGGPGLVELAIEAGHSPHAATAGLAAQLVPLPTLGAPLGSPLFNSESGGSYYVELHYSTKNHIVQFVQKKLRQGDN